MTTVTGDISQDFSAALDQDPWVNANFTAIASPMQLDGNTLRCSIGNSAIHRVTGQTWGNVITSKLEFVASSTFDLVGFSITNSATGISDYEGYFLYIAGTTPTLVKTFGASYPLGGPDTTVIGTYPAITGLAAGDTIELELDQTAHTFTLRHNGAIYQTTGLSNTVTDSTYTANLIPGLFFLGGDVGNDRVRSIAFSGVTSSPTAAVISSPTPSGTLGTATTATLGATTDQNTGAFYGVVDSAANLSGVTKAQVKQGFKASGTAALAANVSAVTTTSPSTGISGLTPSTLYSYAIVQNNGNGDSNLLTGTFTTAAGTPAAVLSAPTPSGTLATTTTATLGATTDQNTGTLYGVVDTAANLSGITISEVKLGARHNGGTNSAFAYSNNTVSTTSPTTAITALTPSTLYSYALVQTNANGDSNLVTGTFTTATAMAITDVNTSNVILSASSGNVAHGVNLGAVTSGTLNFGVQSSAISAVVAASTTVTFTVPTIWSTGLPFTDVNHTAIYLSVTDGASTAQLNLASTSGLSPPFLYSVYPVSAALGQYGTDSAYHNLAAAPANNDQSVWPALGTNGWLILPELVGGVATGRFSVSGGTGGSTVFTIYYRVDSTATWYSTAVTYNFNVSANVAINGVGATGGVTNPTVAIGVDIAITGVAAAGSVTAPVVSASGAANPTVTGVVGVASVTAPTVTVGAQIIPIAAVATSAVTAPTVVVGGGVASGTTGFRPTILELLEEAWERATGGQEMRTGYQLRTARRSFNFLTLDWQNRGYNFWTLRTNTYPLIVGEPTVYLPFDVMDVSDATVSIDNVDRTLRRLTMPDYTQIPTKRTPGSPTQMQVHRTATQVLLTLWPVPNKAYTLTTYELRRIQDAGTGSTVADIPYRFLPAIVAGLAFYIASKIGGDAVNRVPMLKAQYDDAFQAAVDEDRDKGSVFFAPWRRR